MKSLPAADRVFLESFHPFLRFAKKVLFFSQRAQRLFKILSGNMFLIEPSLCSAHASLLFVSSSFGFLSVFIFQLNFFFFFFFFLSTLFSPLRLCIFPAGPGSLIFLRTALRLAPLLTQPSLSLFSLDPMIVIFSSFSVDFVSRVEIYHYG